LLALDPNTGKIKWGASITANDPYDYDEISEHQIINARSMRGPQARRARRGVTASTTLSTASTAPSSPASNTSIS